MQQRAVGHRASISLTAIVIMAAVLPVRAATPRFGYDTHSDFVAFDPHYRDTHDKLSAGSKTASIFPTFNSPEEDTLSSAFYFGVSRSAVGDVDSEI